MFVKQLSIFLENKSGRLASVVKILGNNNIDISALSIADTTDFGILRLIVNHPVRAQKILLDEGYTVTTTEVIAVKIPDKPGSLAVVLDVLEKEFISIEYMYAFVGKSNNEALVILRIEEPAKAILVLEQNNINVASQETIYRL